jgi:hypothetical protein
VYRYGIGLKNAPRNGFTLVKSCVKKIRRFKRKMATARFHSIANYRAPIPNPIMAGRDSSTSD